MKITRVENAFLVELEPEEMESLEEVRELLNDCQEEFLPEASMEEALREVLEAGICWLI